jgi:transposase
MQESPVFVGVDVAKAELVAAVHGHAGCRCIANDSGAIRAWLRELPQHALLAVESTGRYHQMLISLASAAGLQVFVLNARDVYFYAKALGARAKTDPLDAHVIARYLAEHHASLHPWRAPSGLLAQVKALLGQRCTAVTKRTALRESLQGCDAAISCEVCQLDAAFAALLDAIDQRITQLFNDDAHLRQQRQLLQSIVGVGPQASALLTSVLGQVSFADGDALVAYSGLDPRACDSGRSKGRRRLSKRGQPALRRLMYLAAMSACHTKTFAETYRRLRDRGLKTTEALVVLARKLLRIAFAVWRTSKPFDPLRVPAIV